MPLQNEASLRNKNTSQTGQGVLGFGDVTTIATAGRSDVSPTATEILAQIQAPRVGEFFEFDVRNTADASETITLTAGTGVTLSGTMTIGQNNTKRFRVQITGIATPAVTIYSVGTFAH